MHAQERPAWLFPTGRLYLDDPRQADDVRDGWNYTGDAYLQDADDCFSYHSRTDDMIVSAGHNIAAVEVEEVLLQHAAVAECAVIGVADEARGRLVKAFIVLRGAHRPGPDMAKTLQEFVKAGVAPFKYPRAIEFRSELPRTESGKLQRFRLRGVPKLSIDLPCLHKSPRPFAWQISRIDQSQDVQSGTLCSGAVFGAHEVARGGVIALDSMYNA